MTTADTAQRPAWMAKLPFFGTPEGGRFAEDVVASGGVRRLAPGEALSAGTPGSTPSGAPLTASDTSDTLPVQASFAGMTVVTEGELHNDAGADGPTKLGAGTAIGFANLVDPWSASNSGEWVAGPHGANVWHITAADFDRLRRSQPALDRAFGRFVAEQVRASLQMTEGYGARRRSSVLPTPKRPGERPLIKFFDVQGYQHKFFEELNASNANYNYRFEAYHARLTEETVNLAAGAYGICIFVSDQVNANIAEALKDLGVELIALRCAGFDAVDLKACHKLGLTVVRVPAYSPHAVAEHAMALLMCLNRKLHTAYNKVRVGDFSLEGLVGFDLHRKTVGVVGTGKIGACFVDICVGLGCQVLCYDMYPSDAVAKKPNTRYVDLPTLLREADVISLHAPLTESTRHMIDDQALSQTKRGMILINTSRGALVDTKAVIRGLKSGHLGGCGLDVYENERDYFYRNFQGQVIADDVLARMMTFDNVIITSHQGFLTREALSSIASTTLANIREFEDGKRDKQLTNAVL